MDCKNFNYYQLPSDGLIKRGPGARKVGGALFSVTKLSDLKKKMIVLGEPILVYQNKVISKKKLFILGGAISVPKQCDLKKVIVLEGATFIVLKQSDL